MMSHLTKNLLPTLLLSVIIFQSALAEGMGNDMGNDIGNDMGNGMGNGMGNDMGNGTVMDDHSGHGHDHGAMGESSASFCTGAGSTMNHVGFGFNLGNPDRSCVTLLFEDWVLDTEGKFVGAMFGVFFFAMLSEFVGYFHMRMHNALNDDKNILKPVILSTLYVVQALIGFTLMLITMTFNVELLFAVGLGLGVGYLLNILAVGNKMFIPKRFVMCHSTSAEVAKQASGANVESVCQCADTSVNDERKTHTMSVADDVEKGCCMQQKDEK